MHALTKKIFRFAIPTMTSMWIFTLYTIVDGIFIGKYVGSLALGATNIAMPIFNISFGFGIMVAVGASTLISIALAQKNQEEGNYYFNIASLFALTLGVSLSILCFLFLKPLALFLGANELLFPYVRDYIQIILFFFPFYLCGYGWEIYIKVDGNAIYPMFCVSLGALMNIALDYFFLGILHGGVQGAALATGIAQTTTSLLYFIYIVKKSKSFRFQRYRFQLSSIFRIVRTGISEFFTEASSGILILIFNHFSFLYLGNQGIISFSVISYISSFIVMTMIGFAQGVQPILSFSFGEKVKKDIRHIFKISSLSILSLSVFFYFFTCFFSQNLVQYFLHGEIEWQRTALALKQYSLSYLFMGLNILFAAFFTAIKKARYASLITFFRGLLLPWLFLKLLPNLTSSANLWLAAFFAETFTFCLSLYLYQKYKKEILND